MKEQELIKKLDKIVNLYQKLISAVDKANEAGCLEIEGPLFNAIFLAFEGMLSTLEDCLEASGWIGWYIYENKCGESQRQAKTANMEKLKKICNTKDLAEIILSSKDDTRNS